MKEKISFDFEIIDLKDIGEQEQNISHKNFNIFVQQIFDTVKKIWIRIAKIYDTIKNKTVVIYYKKNSFAKNGIEFLKVERYNSYI